MAPLEGIADAALGWLLLTAALVGLFAVYSAGLTLIGRAARRPAGAAVPLARRGPVGGSAGSRRHAA
jgi:hypothetical protein